MDEFGQRLRRLRKTKDITQGQLAEVLGVVPSAVGKYERVPGAYPSVEVLIKLADYFDTSTDYLLRGAPNTPVFENNINGAFSGSSLVQASHGAVIVSSLDGSALSPEVSELIHIYESLAGRERLKLLSFAASLEVEHK